MFYFQLMEEGEEKERKKISMREEGFPVAGPALLAVPWVAAVRCNFMMI
jgi:hypothetical protein